MNCSMLGAAMKPSIQPASPVPPDLSDISHQDWVSRWLPRRWQPYARLCRLDRPVGTWLTLLPCLAALVLAAQGWPEWGRLFIFSLGALLMRGVGCTINDIWDRNLDKQVERTRFRPLTSGQLTLKNALWFLIGQLLVCALLLFVINAYSRWLALALLPVVAVYPLCKRFTHWPQVVLGVGFNWGMLMAWSDTQNTVPLAGVLFWMGAVCWQVGYDTLYAYTDRRDDLKMGMRSTAILFGEFGKWWISAFYALTIALWVWAGVLLGLHAAYYGVLALVAAHFGWQMVVFDLQRIEHGFKLFRANMAAGVMLIVAALAGTLLH